MEAGFQSYLISAPIIDTLETLVNTGAPSGSAPVNIQGTGHWETMSLGKGALHRSLWEWMHFHYAFAAKYRWELN